MIRYLRGKMLLLISRLGFRERISFVYGMMLTVLFLMLLSGLLTLTGFWTNLGSFRAAADARRQADNLIMAEENYKNRLLNNDSRTIFHALNYLNGTSGEIRGKLSEKNLLKKYENLFTAYSGVAENLSTVRLKLSDIQESLVNQLNPDGQARNRSLQLVYQLIYEFDHYHLQASAVASRRISLLTAELKNSFRQAGGGRPWPGTLSYQILSGLMDQYTSLFNRYENLSRDERKLVQEMTGLSSDIQNRLMILENQFAVKMKDTLILSGIIFLIFCGLVFAMFTFLKSLLPVIVDEPLKKLKENVRGYLQAEKTWVVNGLQDDFAELFYFITSEIATVKEDKEVYRNRCGRLENELQEQVEEFRLLQERLKDCESEFRNLLNNAAFPIVVFRQTDNSVAFLNQSAALLFRLDMGVALGRNTLDYCFYPENVVQVKRQLQQNGIIRDLHVTLKDHRGTPFTAVISASMIHYQGTPAILAVVQETGKVRRDEPQTDSGNSDAVTGVYNRRAGQFILEQEMETSRREDTGLLMCRVCLINYEEITARFGRAQGDEALKMLARALESSKRDSDTLFRLDAYRLVVIMPRCTLTDEKGIKARISQAVDNVSAQTQKPYAMQVSMMFFVQDHNPPENAETLLRRIEHERERLF